MCFFNLLLANDHVVFENQLLEHHLGSLRIGLHQPRADLEYQLQDELVYVVAGVVCFQGWDEQGEELPEIDEVIVDVLENQADFSWLVQLFDQILQGCC